jgi:SNF2 family DNA or RNA helicase
MPVAELEYADNGSASIHVLAGYHERHLVEQVAGSRYSNGVWTVPLTWAACQTLRGVFGNELKLGSKLTAWARQLRGEVIDPANKLRDALEVPAERTARTQLILDTLDKIEVGATRKLYAYQRADLVFLISNGVSLLANEPGLGKTGVVIRTIQVMRALGLNPFPVLIVAPNSLKHTVWADELRAWAPELSFTVVDGGAIARRKQLAEDTQVKIVNWESLRLHSRLARFGQQELTPAEKTPKELNTLAPRFVAFDEAHKAKDPNAKQTKAAWALADGATYKVAMTGTPVASNLGDLWSLLRLLDGVAFPAKTKFVSRYAEQTLNYFGGNVITGLRPDTKAELFRVVNPMMRRVPKSAALPQLPPKLPVQYRQTSMSPKQAKAYKDMEDQFMAVLDQKGSEDGRELLTAAGTLAQLTRLIQFSSATAELTEPYEVTRKVKWGGSPKDLNDGRYVLNEDGTVKTMVEIIQDVVLADPSAKVDDLMELLDEMGDAPLVVAAVSRQLIELAAARLEKEKISHGLITGAQSPMERKDAVDRFQSGKNRVILLTLGAGAEGITLTRADTMLFMQRSWSAIQNSQAEDRIHRIGAEIHQSIRIIEQITPKTVEERKLLLLAEKEGRIQEIMRDKDALRKLLGGK